MIYYSTLWLIFSVECVKVTIIYVNEKMKKNFAKQETPSVGVEMVGVVVGWGWFGGGVGLFGGGSWVVLGLCGVVLGWYGVGVGLVWVWCGVGVGLVWRWCRSWVRLV